MHTVLKLKSEFTFPVIDENDLKYHIKKNDYTLFLVGID